MNHLKNRDKLTRFSIRKYSVGVFSVTIASLCFMMGGGIAAANDSSHDSLNSEYVDRERSGEVINNSRVTTRVDSNNQPKNEGTPASMNETLNNKPSDVSFLTQPRVAENPKQPASTDIKYQPKFEGENLGEAKTISIPEGEHYQGEIISYMPEDITIGSRTYVPVVTGPKVITLTGQPQTEEIEYVDKAVAEAINKRKGAVFSKSHEWVRKDDKSPTGDENAHLTFEIKDGATV